MHLRQNPWESPLPLSRRTLLAVPLAAGAAPACITKAHAAPAIRVGTLRFGSVGWELDVMRRHGLDAKAGVAVEPVEFAASQATQVALQAGRVDTIVGDWLWVSRQRAAGADWTLSPNSAALGAIMAPPESPVRVLADVPGRRLGIAGTPLDKSWLLLRAHARRSAGLDLDSDCEKTFGPPPLLAEQAAAGRLDAVLTYWPYAARAAAAGQRQVLAMSDVVASLGAGPGVPFVGYIFSGALAVRDPAALRAFLAAAAEARLLLATSNAEWQRIAPLTGATTPDELTRLRDAYRAGVPPHWNLAAIAPLYDLLAEIGGPALVGAAPHLAPGTIWMPG